MTLNLETRGQSLETCTTKLAQLEFLVVLSYRSLGDEVETRSPPLPQIEGEAKNENNLMMPDAGVLTSPSLAGYNVPNQGALLHAMADASHIVDGVIP